jgi:hypothetical protein
MAKLIERNQIIKRSEITFLLNRQFKNQFESMQKTTSTMEHN